jgi:hypothetical protein
MRCKFAIMSFVHWLDLHLGCVIWRESEIKDICERCEVIIWLLSFSGTVWGEKFHNPTQLASIF